MRSSSMRVRNSRSCRTFEATSMIETRSARLVTVQFGHILVYYIPWASAGRGERGRLPSLEMLKSIFVLQKSPIYCRRESWDAHPVKFRIDKASLKSPKNTQFLTATSAKFSRETHRATKSTRPSEDPISGGGGTTLPISYPLVACGHSPLPLLEKKSYGRPYITSYTNVTKFLTQTVPPVFVTSQSHIL